MGVSGSTLTIAKLLSLLPITSHGIILQWRLNVRYMKGSRCLAAHKLRDKTIPPNVSTTPLTVQEFYEDHPCFARMAFNDSYIKGRGCRHQPQYT